MRINVLAVTETQQEAVLGLQKVLCGSAPASGTEAAPMLWRAQLGDAANSALDPAGR